MSSLTAITMGDPGGIGPEIILKTLSGKRFQNAPLLIVGSFKVFQENARRLMLKFNPAFVKWDGFQKVQSRPISFLDITKEAQGIFNRAGGNVGSGPSVSSGFSPEISLRKTSTWNSALAYASLKAASDLANRGRVRGIVTAPISKTGFRLIDPKFIGHTEFLARAARVRDYAMMFVSPKLKVTLATIHLPLKKVAQAIDPAGILSTIKLTHGFLKARLGIKKPRIGISALNPHGSEFGTEETRKILPAIRKAVKEGIDAAGPFPGDTIFHQALRGKFDAVIAMYHDQGLAPFKMLAFDQGVNVTLGLPYLRTSPDHGTAFDIAYKNKANPSAFRAALELALDRCGSS